MGVRYFQHIERAGRVNTIASGIATLSQRVLTHYFGRGVGFEHLISCQQVRYLQSTEAPGGVNYAHCIFMDGSAASWTKVTSFRWHSETAPNLPHRLPTGQVAVCVGTGGHVFRCTAAQA